MDHIRRPAGRPLRLALVGFGYWGPNYARVLNDLPGVELTVVCDQRADRLAHVRQRYPSVATCDNTADVFTGGRVDAIVVATPASTHRALVQDALEHGCVRVDTAGLALGMAVGDGSGVLVAVAVGVGSGVLVALGVTVFVALGVTVFVALGVTVVVALGVTVVVALGVTVVVAVGLRVAVGVGVSVATTATTPGLLDRAMGAANNTAALLPRPARAGAASIVRPLLVAAADRPRGTTLHVPTMCKPRLPPKSSTIRRYCR